tara:strand:+ start:6864 stop:12245 length:5382 start_codon:yes stop_codon:yes gene_type:complete
MFDNKWQKKEMPLVSLIGMGGGIASPAFLASIVLNILKPTVFSPADDTGVPDFDYNAESSAITNVGTGSITLTGTSGSFIPGSYIKDANSTIIPSDIASVDGSTISFSSAVDLTSITAPLEMVDASGNIITPTTSNVTTTTPIAGSSLVTNYTFTYPNGTSVGSPKLINSAANMHPSNSMPLGDRMLWIKTNNNSNNAISDSVVLNGRTLFTDAADNSNLFSGGVEFGEGFTRLPYDIASLGTEVGNGKAYATEIGVSPGLLDIVTWNGTGTASTDRRIPHSLGSVPGMIIVKRVDGNQDWYVFHTYKGVQYYANLNNSNRWEWTPAATPAWGSAPTTTDFGINENTLSTQTGEYVAYVFAEDTPGKVKCGTYTGNGHDNFVNDIGFAPHFVLIKEAHNSGGITNNGRNWLAANTFMMGEQRFWRPADATHLDGSNSEYINNNSTGIHVKGSDTHINQAGSTYIYLAVAGNDANGLPVLSPDTTQLTFQDNTNLDQLTSGMTISSDIPQTLVSTFSVDTYTGNSSTQAINNGIDLAGQGGLVWLKKRSADGNHWLFDTERGANSRLLTNTSGDAFTAVEGLSFNSDGFTVNNDNSINASGADHVMWSFRKAPGFFDIVTWSGDGSGTRNISHSLGSSPAVMIWKKLNTSSDWSVYHKDAGTGYNLYLNTTDSRLDTSLWGTGPTTTNFPAHPAFNLTGEEYVAYLFADNPSNEIKCGSYTGSGVGTSVNVGFRPHWVLIKSSTYDETNWVIADSSRPGELIWPNKWDAGYPMTVSFSDSGFSLDSNSSYLNSSGYTYTYVAIGSPTGLSGAPTAKLTADADPSTNTAIIDASSWTTGYSVTGPAFIATASGFDEDTINLTLTDTTVSKVSDGSLVGVTIDQALTIGETVQADTAVTGTVTAPVFTTTLWSGTGSAHEIVTGIDNTANTLIWTKSRNYSNSHRLYTPAVDNIIGNPSILFSNVSNSVGSYGVGDFSGFTANGFTVSADSNANTGPMNSTNLNYVAWNFRAAPGFLDIVTYTSQSGVSAIDHNLGSVPGCIIVKKLNGGTSWQVYHKDLDSGKLLELDGYQDQATRNGFPSAPTSTQFFIDPISHNTFGNVGDQFVAYLFAEDTPGLIKCGLYTGNGSSSQTINLGFETGLLITKPKNLDQGWMIIDSERKTDSGTHNAFSQPNELSPDNSFNEFHSLTSTGFTAGSSANASNRQTIYIAIAKNPEMDITSDIYASGTVSSSSGNTIALSNTTGTWSTGMKIQGTDSDTKDNPDAIRAENIVLTSSAPSAEKPVSTWGNAIWEIATDENFTQNVQTATTALSATGTQAGPSFVFERETGYYTRTKYTALGQESEWSDVTYFVTRALYVDSFWIDLFNTNGWDYEYAEGIDSDDNGNIYVISIRYSAGGSGYKGMSLVKLDSNGVIKWQKYMTYNIPGDRTYPLESRTVSVTPDGSEIFVTAQGDLGMLVSKFNSDGILQWSKKLGVSNSNNYSYGTTLTSSGELVMFGKDDQNSGSHTFVTQISSNGSQTFYSSIGRTSGDTTTLAFECEPFTDSDDNIHFVINSWNGSKRTPGVVKYNSSGVLQSVSDFNSSVDNSIADEDHFGDIAVDGSGNKYITYRRDVSGMRSGLLKLNSSDEIQWQSEISSNNPHYPLQVNIDSSGNIVSAFQDRRTNSGIIITKHTSDGTLVWKRSFRHSNTEINPNAEVRLNRNDNIILYSYTYGDVKTIVCQLPSTGGLTGTYNTSYGNFIWEDATHVTVSSSTAYFKNGSSIYSAKSTSMSMSSFTNTDVGSNILSANKTDIPTP